MLVHSYGARDNLEKKNDLAQPVKSKTGPHFYPKLNLHASCSKIFLN